MRFPASRNTRIIRNAVSDIIGMVIYPKLVTKRSAQLTEYPTAEQGAGRLGLTCNA